MSSGSTMRRRLKPQTSPRAPAPYPPDKPYVPDMNNEWDRLRAQLKPCPKCGEAKDLLFKCAQMCRMAHVYCGRCGAGTPADTSGFIDEIIVWGEEGADSRPAAVEKWNAVKRNSP